MSKFRIPSTQSNKDPYALERSVETLTPSANPISVTTGGNELETLTPFQIEEGKGFLGNSQYQQQAQLNQLANDEDFWSLTAKGLKNLAGTVVTEIGKTPGYVVGGLGAVGNELFSDGKDSMKMMVDNSWVNAFESLDQSIKDFMPVHVKQEVLDGNVWDKLTSYGWWAETGSEGIGFLLAMYGPGALLKAGKVGQRIMGGIEKLSEAGVDVANWMNLPMDTLKPYKMSLNTARKFEGYAGAVSNAVIESAAEAANTFDNIKTNKKQEYLNQGLPEDQAEQLANQDAGKGAAAVFKTNMIILPVSNALEEKWLWKSVGLSGQDEAAEGLINQFMKNGVLDVEGLKQATKKTFKEQAGTYSKNFLKNFAKEGAFEEGLQTVTQQQVEKGNIKDNALEQFWNSITSYADDFENNKELHESIALGGLLGGGASIFTSINEARNNEEAIYGSKQGKFDGILNKIGLRQERKDQRGLSNLLKENWINNFKSYEDLLTDGKLDQEKLVKLPQEQQSLANLHFLYDASVQTGDKLTQNIVGQYLATNYAQPFLGQVGGKEIFQQHVENQVVPEWTNRFKNLTGRDATNIEINEFKKRFLESANPVFDNYNKVEDTHYPERYYQDKENPTRYKEFKDHYFKQKLQALTNVTAADKQIAEATTKITIGDNLTGIQKTNNKIAESEIESANKVKKEAADYYESLFTKKGVKELYDLYSKQEDTVAEVLNEIQQDQSKDAVVAEQKIAEIKNVEQQLDNSIDPDKPLTVKTKDGQLLDVMVDTDGKKYVLDNGNVREISGEDILQNDIKVVQPEDLQREVQKQESTQEPIIEINTEEPIDEKQYEAFLQNDLGTGLYPSTGLHVAYEYSGNRVVDKLTSDGLPQLNESKHQKTWFDTLDKIKNIDEYQVKAVNRTNADSEQLRVINANAGNQLEDTDLFIFLYQNDKPVIVDNDPVFTSLWKPDSLYKDLSKQGISPRLAPQSVLNSYLNSIGISNKETLELSELSDQELNKLESVIGKSNMNDSGLWRVAVQWAKEDYTNWYNSLQQPNTFLQPIAITNGKRLIRRNQDRSIVWNPVKNNIPDFDIKNQKLVNGDLVQQYTPQGIQVGDKFYKLRIGDTAIVSNNQLYRLKQSNINQSEAKTVLYLLSLKDLNAPQESIKLPVRTVIKQKTKSGGYNNKTYTETPVFGSNTEYGIIKSLINFSYGQTKGSIYLNGNNVEYVDWNGNLQIVPIQQIQNAFLDDDFSNVQNLLDFLQQKKFNVNENLLRADSDFQYPKLVRTSNGGYNVEFENKGKYKAYLLEDEKLLTDSVIAEGYPKRLARNLQFAKQPTIQVIEESKVETIEEPKVDPRLERLKNRPRTAMPDLNAFSKITEEDESIIASEKTIRDLAARMSDRIGIPYRIISDRTEEYKGKIENGVYYINLAYATLDTPVHEILGHPIIRTIRNRKFEDGSIEEYNDFMADYWVKHPKKSKEEVEKYVDENFKPKIKSSQLYENLLKELEYGKGKEVFEQVKRDYNKKTENVPSWYKHIDPEKNTWIEQIQGLSEYWHSEYSQRLTRGRQFDTNEELEKLLKQEQEKYNKYYTLEEQQEEALVTLLGLMTAEKLDAVKDGKLISLLKRLLKEMKQFIRSLINQKEVEIDKLPDNMTISDLSDLLAYSNSKLILPGYEVEYTTPDNNKFKTYQEASNHISDLAKSVEDVDLNNVGLNIRKKVEKASEIPVNKFVDEFDNTTYNKKDGKWYVEDTNRVMLDDDILTLWNSNLSDNYINKAGVEGFIEKNKEYEQSKEIIEEWKKVNNIQYNPEEIYSRGQEFSSVVGAYSDFDVNLMMQNLLSHIEDNEKAGGKFAISAYTKPIDKQIGHLEGGGGKIKFKIYPQSNDILWAANTDVYSGSVWDASEKVNKDKKSELLGVSYTKYPSLSNVNTVQPNLANIVDNLNHHHNELGIVLTGNNFRLEYDDDIPYQTKKILNSINAILDQKYGRLVKPKIDKVQKEPKLLQWKISPVGPGSKTEWALEYLYSDNFNDYSGDVKFFDTKEEAELFVKTLDKKSNQQIGVQPIQTNETLKESINSVVQKVSKYGEGRLTSSKEFTIVKQDEYNNAVQKGIKGFALGTIEFGYSETYEYDGFIYTQIGYDPSKEMFISENEFQSGDIYGKIKVDNKEYLSQVLINTKISKLKEVAKKYPRSLIRSEVRRIGYSFDSFFDMFEDELLFSKITKKVSPLRKRIEELKSRRSKNLPNLNADKIFSPTDMLKQKLQSGEITKYCK